MDRFLQRSNSLGKRPLEGPRTESEWKIPKHTAHPRSQQPPPGVKTSNKFSVLNANTNFTDPAMARLREACAPKNKSSRLPPILMELKQDWTHDHIKTLIGKYTSSFHIKYKGNNKISVVCYTAEGHEAVKTGLRTDGVAYHTFTRKDEKALKAVIFGLPAYAENDLKEELASLGYKDVVVRKMKVKDNKYTSSPPFLAQLPPGSDIACFHQIKYLSNCVVQIKKYRANNLYGSQCFRCQGFGHASRNCNLPPRCVKCTESHLTADCPKTDRTEPAKCCNCNEAHPANFRKCKERQKYLQTMTSRQQASKSKTDDKKPLNNNLVDGRPWNFVSAGKQAWIPTSNTKYENTEDNATSDMLAILKCIKAIKRQFLACDDMMDKVILILSHLGHYV
ncbi:hypothetical protein O0L34_g4564 [Tuta absoluta]|nr:hypothetical protein O0L34_g4564 [Tuta absoluta]